MSTLKQKSAVKKIVENHGYVLWVWLKKPLNKGNKPYVYADVVRGQKFYDLPCHIDNIFGVVIKPK